MRKITAAAMSIIMCVMCLFTVTAFADDGIGDGIEWKIDGGVLTISGKGAMADFKAEKDAPWYSQRSKIEQIVVADGITHIGDLAFYGCINAKTASVAESVESIGINAFSYTEGSVTSIDSVNAPFQFTVTCDETYVKKGQEFYITINLKGDFKDVSVVQHMLVFDSKRVSADTEDWCDAEWLKTVGDSNLGYISAPLNGIVTNTVRVAYISMSGNKIDADSPLYTAGETQVTTAKLKFTALDVIDNINTSCFYLKECKVGVSADNLTEAECGVTQLTTSTILPIRDLTIVTDSEEAAQYAANAGINTVSGDGNPVASKPVENENDKNNSENEKFSMVSGGITVTIDDVAVDDFDVPPALVNDSRVVVPMRKIFEKLDAKVSWDNETETAFGVKGSTLIAFQIGNKTMTKSSTDGESATVELDVPAMLVNDRTLVPIRAISESFNCKVDWVDETQTVVITTK